MHREIIQPAPQPGYAMAEMRRCYETPENNDIPYMYMVLMAPGYPAGGE